MTTSNSDIIVCGSGINWCWYTGYRRNSDGTISETFSDRFHRFNPDQGADQHPTPTHQVARTIRPVTEKMRADPDWPADWIAMDEAAWQEACDRAGGAQNATSYFISLTSIETNEREEFAVRATA